jgi:hypothetical protein
VVVAAAAADAADDASVCVLLVAARHRVQLHHSVPLFTQPWELALLSSASHTGAICIQRVAGRGNVRPLAKLFAKLCSCADGGCGDGGARQRHNPHTTTSSTTTRTSSCISYPSFGKRFSHHQGTLLPTLRCPTTGPARHSDDDLAAGSLTLLVRASAGC